MYGNFYYYCNDYIYETEWEGVGEGLVYLSVMMVLLLIIGEMKV